MINPKRPETVEEFAAKAMSGRLNAIIRRIGDLGGDLRLVQARVDSGVTGDGTYARLAAEVQNLIVTALYNAAMHDLANDAEEADRARTKRLTAEAIAVQIDDTATDTARLGAESHVDGMREGAFIAREYAAKEG